MRDPKAEQQQEYLERLRLAARNSLTPESIEKIFRALVEKAERGDMWATELIIKLYGLAPHQEPPAALPAPTQQVRANTVNIYADGKRRKPSKLIDAGPCDRTKASDYEKKLIGNHRNGN